MNPYEPPPNHFQHVPFWKRFRRAMGRAMREYRAGLVREKFTSREHLRAWLAILFVAWILLLMFIGLMANILQFLFNIKIPI